MGHPMVRLLFLSSFKKPSDDLPLNYCGGRHSYVVILFGNCHRTATNGTTTFCVGHADDVIRNWQYARAGTGFQRTRETLRRGKADIGQCRMRNLSQASEVLDTSSRRNMSRL